MEVLTGLFKFFIEISLGYIDECCLGYTFYKKEDGAFKSAADGVVIYAKNTKKLLKDAVKTMFIVILTIVTVTVILFIVLGLLFRLLNWNGIIAFLLSILIAMVIKFAFVDSYILVKTMTSYMEVAPSTQITFDITDKLCNISSKFKELFKKGEKEKKPQVEYAGNNSYVHNNLSTPVMGDIDTTQGKTNTIVFCTNCGAKNKKETKFCTSCGSKM